ncbi:nitroreductase family protein [Candidatus Woesearchaeota archaeon]|nr:nitroreductase family protein [Candidatus Woesearchaeota archaeon]
MSETLQEDDPIPQLHDIVDIIKYRRTVKYFLPKYVSWDKISRILDAARHAPSSGNIQNWKFIVVMDSGRKQGLAQACYEQYDLAVAPYVIVIVSETEKAERYYGVRGDRLYAIQNCAAAAQNILLAATGMGLGSAWIGAFDEDAVRSLLGVPAEVRPQIIIPIGYAREIPPKPAKYPLETVVYINRWRGKFRDVHKYMNDTAVILARKTGHAKEALEAGISAILEKTKDKLGIKKEEHSHDDKHQSEEHH